MSALSNYLENALANLVFKGVAFTPLSTTYVGLHTAVGATEATADWLATELTTAAINYARVAVAAAGWSGPVDGMLTNVAEVAFAAAGSNWGTVTHFSVWDLATLGSGNLLAKEQLATSRIISTGDPFKFPAGNLQVGFA